MALLPHNRSSHRMQSVVANILSPTVDDGGRPARSHTIDELHARTLIALHIEALQRGQALWFRVSSGSMRPLFRLHDTIYIQPIQVQHLQRGDIIAFRRNNTLIVHRLLALKQEGATCRLLQMGDAAPFAAWITAEDIAGRVVLVRRDRTVLPLQTPLARWWGYSMAMLRYQLYLYQHIPGLNLLLRGTARLWRELGGWYLYRWYRQNEQ